MATEDDIRKELEKSTNQIEVGMFAQIAALKDLVAELFQSQLGQDRKMFDQKFMEYTQSWEAHFKEEIIQYASTQVSQKPAE